MEQILISKDNCINILKGFVKDLKNKINNKNLSTPYIEQFTKAGVLKVDGNGDMFLCNNGEYVKIDLSQISITQEMINTIYDLFKIEKFEDYKWETNDLPVSAQGSTAQVYNDKIYCISGYGGISNKVLIQDIKSKTWGYGANVTSYFYYGTSQIYNKKIYCLCGEGVENLTQIYDIESNTWSLGTPVNNESTISYTSSILYKNKIYCIGGYNALNTIYIYDITTNIWTTKNIPFNIAEHISKLYNNKIYCINTGSHKIYDIKTETWSDGPKITGKQNFTGEIYKDILYCIGFNNTISTFDFNKNVWGKLDILNPKPVDRQASVIYKNEIYTLGGFKSGPSNIGGILYLPYSNYDIKLPEELDNKLNIIKSDGKGNKLLTDNGTYIDPSNNYTVIQDNEILDLVNQICNKEE